MKKCCLRCGKDKDVGLFSKDSRKLDGIDIYCKECKNKYSESYRSITKTLPNEKYCKKCHKIKDADEFNKNCASPDGLRNYCKSCRKEDTKSYNAKVDSEKRRIYAKHYRLKNKEKILLVSNLWKKNKTQNDEVYRLKINVSSLIRVSLLSKNTKKKSRTCEILGCTIEEFYRHIESQFENWMSWENQGNVCKEFDYNCSWDLDHIIPLSWAKTEEEVYALNHWSNFQPLCSKVNRNNKKDFVIPVCNIELNITVY